MGFSNNQNIKLLVGLGNPSIRYANTRHNVGFMVADLLARRYKLNFRSRSNLALEAQLEDMYLIKPLTFMNASGKAVKAYVQKYALGLENVLIIHDDLDMPLGRLRFKKGGQAGGQRGVRDIIDCVGSDFLRLKLGISRPAEDIPVIDWVLSPFAETEVAVIEQVIIGAVEAIELLLTKNLATAMNRFNGLDFNQVL